MTFLSDKLRFMKISVYKINFHEFLIGRAPVYKKIYKSNLHDYLIEQASVIKNLSIKLILMIFLSDELRFIKKIS